MQTLTLPNGVITTNCSDFNVEKALNDIKQNKANLLLYGSIAPSTGPADKDFKKKFGVVYMIFGDDETTREECKKIYNRVVFQYLDKKFGNKWRKEVRKDVVGLNDK